MKSPKETVVLVVDDEADLRNAIAFDFKRKGFQVQTAVNGTEAFKLLQQTPVDVIISDIRMPGGDGVQLLNDAKGMDPKLPVVIFITGHSDISVDEAYDRGADAIFSKPFDRKALFAAVDKAIRTKEENWRGSQPTDSPTKSFDLSFPDLKSAQSSRRFNLGRGGIFIAIGEPFPALASPVTFHVKFAQQPSLSSLKGNGIVRWVRKEVKGDLPTGCGIEITHLEDDAYRAYLSAAEAIGSRAFIPKV